MKRILFNRGGNAWGVVAAAACVAGAYGALAVRRLQLRRRAAWPQRIVIMGGSRSSHPMPSALERLIDRAAMKFGEFGPPAADE
ncbi:MAG TPA: hypothetical protein VKP30_00880 [Polyangiaceae bacterium]|nr:hypothetical protein [Polyangiaceae bacterium]